ncbi:hypothetical protein BGZ54_006541, partial [Gamsiella multidivaricata]
MSVKPDPARATSPPSASTLPATVSPIAQVHQQPQEHSALPLHRLESSSTSRTGTPTFASGYNLPHSSESGDFRASHSPFIPDVPVNDSNTYTGRPVLDSSRRYSSGYPSIALSSVQASPTSGGSTLANKRLSKFGGQALTLAPTPESPSAGQVANTNTSAIIHTPTSATIHTPTSAIPTAIRRSISGFHTFVPDFINSPHDPDHSSFSSGLQSPAFSISSFSGIIPSSNSISSIHSAGQSKPPALEHKHPITVKDFDSILLLGPSQQAAIKTLCSNRVLRRIDTIGWYSILGAQKFPTIISSQDAYDIEMATTCMAIEFGANNAQTQNFNTLVLQLLSQIKLIKDRDYKGSSPSAYEFYEEALNLIIVMASTQLQHPTSEPSEKNYFLNLVLEKFSQLADQLTLRLLWNFTDQRPGPPLAGGLVYNAYSYLFAKAGSSPSSEAHPIADRSILVLLLLHSQAKGNPEWDAFKRSIQNIRDERGPMADDVKDNIIFTPFRKIFHVVCQQIHCEEVCLLLHVLLVENTYFRTYVLSRTDPETLYLPILRMVYEGVEGRTNYSQVYVLLVILLLFSQDDVFNESIQKIPMTYQPWFTERLLKSISLGGLAVAIIIRTIQYNLAQHKDVYFHTNSLAILANMSNSLQDMHPYVSQRLVTLFDIVARRYQKLVTKHAQLDENIEKNADVIIYGDMVVLVLEIINSTLTHKLKTNPQLVYSLLHKQEMFAYFRNDLKFKDLIQNIEQAANIKAPTPEEVAQVIQTASRTWPPNLMKTFPDIKFEYEEEEQANEFFCPYVWSLLYRNTFVYWDEEKAKILHDYRTVMNDESAFEGVPTG